MAHAYCNLAAAAHKVNSRRRVTLASDEQPYRWSRRWFDDPPVGTINYDGGCDPEIYVGNGDWQPLDAPSREVAHLLGRESHRSQDSPHSRCLPWGTGRDLDLHEHRLPAHVEEDLLPIGQQIDERCYAREVGMLAMHGCMEGDAEVAADSDWR